WCDQFPLLSGCIGSPPLSISYCNGSSWVIDGSPNLPSVLTIDGSSVIAGDLTLQPSATLVLNSVTVPLVVQGAASVSGILNITLSTAVSGGEQVVVLQADNITGNFARVNVVVPQPDPCKEVKGSPRVSSNQVAVLLSVSSSCGGSSGGLSKGAIAGIVV